MMCNCTSENPLGHMRGRLNGFSDVQLHIKARAKKARPGMTSSDKFAQEKRAAGMNKRPKSREETPKEGSDRARPYRTATICDRDAQNARIFELVPVQCATGWRIGNTSRWTKLFK